MSRVPILSVQNLGYRFGSGRAVTELSFELNLGEILAFLGPNGVGKTTALKAIAGILSGSALEGRVMFRGQNLSDLTQLERARRIVYLPSEFQAEFPLTVMEAVSLGRLPRRPDEKRVQAALERCGAWQWRDRGLDSLSGGERQWVAFARALAQESEVLLLDESFSKLDLDRQSQAKELLVALAKEGKAVVLVSHDLNFAVECATHMTLWPRGGPAVSGPSAEMLSNDRIAKVFPGARVYESRSGSERKVFLGF